MKKKVWLPIIIVILLLALAGGGVYAFLYRPVEETFASAMAKSQTAPYAEAQSALAAALQELEGKPFAQERVAALAARQEQLFQAELDRAVAADELLMFATKTCPNCRQADKLLTEAGIPYRKLLVEEHGDEARRLGVRQAPTLVRGDRILGVGVAAVRKFIQEEKQKQG